MKTDMYRAHQGAESLHLIMAALLPVLLLTLMLFLNGCTQNVNSPPVIVSKPVCLLHSAHNAFSHAGVSFECHNTGDSTLSSLEVTFRVFSSASGGNPFYGSNAVTAEVTAALPAGETGTFEISLDEKLAFIPTQPFLIDYFYVSRATFSDGSVWSDAAGIYYAGSLP